MSEVIAVERFLLNVRTDVADWVDPRLFSASGHVVGGVSVLWLSLGGVLAMRKYFVGWVAAIALSMPVAASAGFSNMYVLGDSLSDNGNLYNWTDAPNPVTGGNPIPVTDFGPISPLYATGRFENGKSYSELLWSGLQSAGHLAASGDLTPRGLKPWGPPAIDPNPPAGTNYAVGGARSRYHSFDVGAGLPPVGLPTPGSPGSALFSPFSLRGQFNQFVADSGGVADPKALFTVWSGSNDVGDVVKLYAAGKSSEGATRLTEAIQDIGFVLGGLVASGVDYLLVPNVPDLGLVPETNGNPLASALATALSRAYDVALAGILDTLSALNPDVTVYRFDSFGFLREVTASPGDFGFTNVKDPCLVGLFVSPPPTGPVSVCGNRDDYLFWDTIHPSARAHEFLAARMLEAVPEPATVLLVGIGLAAFGVRTRRNRQVATAHVASVASVQ